MATLELPLPVQNIARNSSTGVQSKECGVGHVRFSASNGWRSSLSLSCKEARSRAPRCMSVDVDNSETADTAETADTVAARKAAEKFAVLDTGKWECRSCGFVYDQSKGESSYPIAPGTEFRRLPEDWRCPTCGAAQSYFNSKSIEVAGFAENQNYGLGTNSLTSNQKSLLIYGSLLFFFCLFLSGYFLQ